MNNIKKWFSDRLKERTTWDGVVLTLAGITYLIFEPIAYIIALVAIIYGVWTMFTAERNKGD